MSIKDPTKNTNFKIIVIDDNPEIHRDFIKILKTESFSELDNLKNDIFGINPKNEWQALPRFEIDVASQGQEGVERIEQGLKNGQPYSLAFVDIRMPPGWDGIETIKHIWALDANVQIVICTAYSDYSWEDTISHLGQKDNLLILKKPFDNISVRQLACALTKKWELAVETHQYTHSLQKEVAKRTHDLEHQATHDSLTGLVNRVKLLDKLQLAIKVSEENNLPFAIFFLDLDRFKLINDSLSHAVGDEILIEVAQRLKNAMRNEDTVSRLGGDEFVIVIMNVEKKKDIYIKLNQVIDIFHEPFNIADRLITLTPSIGVSQYPKDGKTIDVLLQNADIAMYDAKSQKGNVYKFYSAEMSMKTLEELDREMELRVALEKNEFFLVYQPQMNISTGKIEAIEALIRWNNPKRGLVLPLDFIPLAEETGLIVPITDWVLREACKQNKAWHEQGFSKMRVAVNITLQQFKQGDLVSTIENILEETKLEPQYLELELTENVVLNNTEILRILDNLKELGIIIAIDDFGTGYSSLSYLRKIPLDRLKIDQSFVKNIQSATDDEVIIRAVIAMANSLNLEVLAEGVETIEQLNFLKKNKCKEAQGYYFSKPLTTDELEDFLKKNKP